MAFLDVAFFLRVKPRTGELGAMVIVHVDDTGSSPDSRPEAKEIFAKLRERFP